MGEKNQVDNIIVYLLPFAAVHAGWARAMIIIHRIRAPVAETPNSCHEGFTQRVNRSSMID